MLTEKPIFDKISIDPDGWITCPICRNKHLKRVYPDEAAALIYVHCRRCKNEIPIKLNQGQCLQGQSQQ